MEKYIKGSMKSTKNSVFDEVAFQLCGGEINDLVNTWERTHFPFRK